MIYVHELVCVLINILNILNILVRIHEVQHVGLLHPQPHVGLGMILHSYHIQHHGPPNILAQLSILSNPMNNLQIPRQVVQDKASCNRLQEQERQQSQEMRSAKRVKHLNYDELNACLLYFVNFFQLMPKK